MDLFLSRAAIEGLNAERKAAWQATADGLTDQLLDEVKAQTERMVEVPNEDGARAMTATIFLLRAVELLREIRDTDGTTLHILGLRTVFELAIAGRYLLDHPDGADEYRRLFSKDMESEKALAQSFENAVAPPPPFLAHILESTQEGPRALLDLARGIDALEGRAGSEDFSAERSWRLVHKYVSQSVSHANAVSIKRFTTGKDGVLGVKPDPPPVFTDPPDLLVTCFVADLARSVFAHHNITSDRLPEEFQRPSTGDNANSAD